MNRAQAPSALIGYSGFVGSTLLRQASFDELYRSTNAIDMEGRSFGLAVCSAAPAQKWLANREPEKDWANIAQLIERLKRIECERLVLISTVDVFAVPQNVDESSEVPEKGLHPYGLHRRMLEQFVQQKFPSSLIVRLPGLVGPGLRKNVLFDFRNENNLDAVDSRSVFQFYPMVNLWADIQLALSSDLQLVHFAAEPLSVAEVAQHGFCRQFSREGPQAPARYDMRSRHASLFGARGSYQYSKREVLLAIRAYAQSEPIVSKGNAE